MFLVLIVEELLRCLLCVINAHITRSETGEEGTCGFSLCTHCKAANIAILSDYCYMEKIWPLIASGAL